ncbi:MAG: diaminopimelate epimerase [Planctomycetaceae bacterium]
MQFTKMHGAGNDYVFVDCMSQPPPQNPARLARRISDRHRGVGADGLILIHSSQVGAARMQMFNTDGSLGEMCGNGIRCLAKYLFDHGHVTRRTMTIETGHGPLELELTLKNAAVDRVRVNMGRPVFAAAAIPTDLPGEPPLNVPLGLAGRSVNVCCVGFGNPHCVVFTDELTDELVCKLGPAIEQHGLFPKRVNVGFAQVHSPRSVRLRVWERGTGETQACGTGASAALVTGVLTGRLQRRVVMQLPGGVLDLEWDAADDVYLTGPAVEVFTGSWPDD